MQNITCPVCNSEMEISKTGIHLIRANRSSYGPRSSKSLLMNVVYLLIGALLALAGVSLSGCDDSGTGDALQDDTDSATGDALQDETENETARRLQTDNSGTGDAPTIEADPENCPLIEPFLEVCDPNALPAFKDSCTGNTMTGYAFCVFECSTKPLDDCQVDNMPFECTYDRCQHYELCMQLCPQ